MKRIQHGLIVLLALAPVFLFAYLGQFSRHISDLDCPIATIRNMGFWDGWRYLAGVVGRDTNFLLVAVIAPLDTLVPVITPLAMIATLLVGWHWLVWQGLALLKISHARRALSLAIAACIVTSTVYVANQYTWELLYHWSVIMTYLIPFALFILYMALTVWMGQRLGKNRRSALGVEIIAGGLSGLICFIIGGFSEPHAVAQLFILTLCLLLLFALVERSVRAPYALLCGAGWLGTAVSLIAQLRSPGIAYRTEDVLAKRGAPDLSVEVVAPKIFGWIVEHLTHPGVLTGFIMLLGVGLLVTLVKYKPRMSGKASRTFEFPAFVLWLGLAVHLLVLPWHGFLQSRLNASAEDGRVMLILNVLFIAVFLMMLWQRRRINAWLRKRGSGLLFFGWVVAAVFAFVLLFDLTQTRFLYFYSAVYLLLGGLVFLGVLACLPTGWLERRLGLLAYSPYVLGCVLIVVIVVMISLSAQGFADSRTLLAGACLLVLSGLVWGVYIGVLAKHYLALADRPWAEAPLKLVSAAAVAVIAFSIMQGQVADIPDWQNFARVWDANHQKILAAVQEGKGRVEVSPLPLHNRWYLRGCPGRYYRLGSTEVVIMDE